MKKIAIFVEGNTELIFIRDLLLKTFDNSFLKLECTKLFSKSDKHRPFYYSSPDPKIYFRIIDVGNDEGVLKAIEHREKGLIGEGFINIIGLRDMYSAAYSQFANDIDESIINKFIIGNKSTIEKMSDPTKIKLHFAIMEIEAWFLAIHKIFERIDKKLTIKFIKEKLNIDLQQVDPQKKFFKPSNILSKIFQLIDLRYSKKTTEVERIVKHIRIGDLEEVENNGKVTNFVRFYSDIKKHKNDLQAIR